MWRRRHVFILLTIITVLNVSVWQATNYPDEPLSCSSWYDWGLYGLYPRLSFRSSPLQPPLANLVDPGTSCSNGYTLIAPRGNVVWQPGPVMLDQNGDLVWMDTGFGTATDVKVQWYKGQRFLTFWVGIQEQKTFGKGVYVMLDESYRIYRTISAASGLSGDLHDFRITHDNTALITVYEPAPADLSVFGIDSPGWIQDSMFQEIDIETNALLFEWRASHHFHVNDSYATPQLLGNQATSPMTAFDFFHINSVTKTISGEYVISSRYMKSIICINQLQDIVWALGGKRNNFTDLSSGSAATSFEWQHHATIHESDNTTLLTIFDNARADGWSPAPDHSRGLLLSLDTGNFSVSLVQQFISPFSYGAESQGSAQLLLDSDSFLVGWGAVPAYTEYKLASGEVLCDVHFGPSLVNNLGWVTSYRAHRTSEWVGRPLTRPDVYLEAHEPTAYVSWNGATEVKWWRLQGVDAPLIALSGSLAEDRVWLDLGDTARDGFETEVVLAEDVPQYIRIVAVDRRGEVLGYTEVVDRLEGNVRKNVLVAVLEISAAVLIGCLGAAYAIWKCKPWKLDWKRSMHLLPLKWQSLPSKKMRKGFRPNAGVSGEETEPLNLGGDLESIGPGS